jgi:hypothetical protein
MIAFCTNGNRQNFLYGFVREVLQELPMEFAVEAQKLVAISLEGSVGWGDFLSGIFLKEVYSPDHDGADSHERHYD